MAPEELLHLFGPFLPTDRFRALLQGVDLPSVAQGAALMIDISGFTPLSSQLVQKYGARRASEELRRRLNPMFEATTGQVFQHGGSVIRLVGDGFMAWFDDQQQSSRGETTSGIMRAAAAAINMQSLMSLFPALSLKIGIGIGTAFRWVVGQERYGLSDVLSGPAVEAMIQSIELAQPGQIVLDPLAIAELKDSATVSKNDETEIWTLTDLDPLLMQNARRHRWAAWQSEINIYQALDAVRPYIDLTLRNAIESGLGNFTNELRWACPMFIRINNMDNPTADSRTILNRCVSHIQDVLIETGGRLVSVEISDKGSVVFAVFGAPVTYGDDAQRAFTAATTLRKTAISDQDSMCLYQFGISRGLLYAGIVGGEARHEYSTIGDETNIAARLMTAAKPDQILITSHIRESLKRRISFRDLTPVKIKGRENPVAVSEALNSEVETHQSHNEVFVGRHAELDQFSRALKAIGNGVTRILSVEGDPGVGKSRLLNELGRLATQQNYRLLRGNCLSAGRNTPYLPWREAIIELFELSVELPDEVNAEHLTILFRQINPNWLWRLPLLTDLLQLPLSSNPTVASLSGRNRQQALSTLVIDLLRYFAAQKPLVVIFDDIHWIDEVSEALVLDLVRSTSASPMDLCLALSQRLLTGEHSGIELNRALEEHRAHVSITLNELTHSEVAELITKRFGEASPLELTSFVYEQTRGNPFLIHEILDMLEETGALRVRYAQITITHPLNELKLPNTAHELVQARIDRLDETDKLILKVASVIGRQFSTTLLERSIPFPIVHDELVQRLASLEAHEFVHRENDEPDVVYRFSHAITQDVAYESLPFIQREQIHQLVGTTLKAISPDEVDQLAYHFVHSGKEFHVAAREYLTIAAYKAIREYANQSALTYLQQAIELTENSADEFKLRLARLDVLLRIGQLDGIEGEIDYTQRLVTASKRIDWQSAVGLRRAQHLYQLGTWLFAIREAEAAWQTAIQLGQDDIAWEVGLLLFGLYRTVGQVNDLEKVLPAMSQIVARLDDPRKDIQLALQELTGLYPERPKEALTGAKAVLVDAEKLDDAALQAACWSLLSNIHFFDRNYPAALVAIGNELALYRRMGSRHDEGTALFQLAWMLILLGQLSEASQLLTQSFTIMHQLGERFGEATSLNGLGIIAWLRYAYDEALAYLKRGMMIVRDLNTETDIGVTAFHIGNASLGKGEVDAAREAFQEAFEKLIGKGHIVQASEAEAGLAELSLYLGDLPSAHAQIRSLCDVLLHDEVSHLQQPGLAYWRVIHITRALGQTEIVAQVMEKALAYQAKILSTLDTHAERATFSDHLWYIKAVSEYANK